ncbi:flagellar filament capping protein FliD [Croceicoccus gelatinilyticus]|uniref:flagellar filament capping protein FliD n=1 Tax=Croceicoccus gelatinilyticus TaxID=2835536 RepID=UPI001BCFE99D|nr:flagellar filament capping protein FliD [Croceicoccus gelatinilyticus]MBS7671344.1 flagellar filament capping protein FliD [Croceicoccus gelatinilyticus]
MTTTSSTSAASSIISALGAGSGIDMSALASDLAVAQYASRLQRLENKSQSLETRISSASNLKAMLLSLSTSLGDRVRMGDLSAEPSIGNASVATGTLSNTVQPTGSYSLEVEQLAQGQMLASAAYGAATDVVGAGTMTIRYGEVAGGVFTEDTGHASVDIEITPGMTLTQTAQAISASGAGLTAYVSNTVDGPRLMIKGAEGAQNGFVIDVVEDGANPGLSSLAWQPGAGTSSLLQESKDATFQIDGLSRTSTSNTVVEAIPGVNLELTGTNVGAPTTVRFADPSSAIRGAVQDLTSAMNEIAAELNAATDPVAGELARDSGARALRQTFAGLTNRIVMPNAAEGDARTLADLGISVTRYGTFEFDPDRLAKTMERDPDGVTAMFTTGIYGVYGTFDTINRNAASTGNPGSLAGSISRYNNDLKQASEQREDLLEDQEVTRARLVTQFASTNTRISSYQSTLSFLQNQIAAWNKSDD